jgi:hypothetical protein
MKEEDEKKKEDEPMVTLEKCHVTLVMLQLCNVLVT